MKKQAFLIVLLFVLLFMTTLVFGANIQKNRIPADVDWLIHFDMNKFKTTSLFELLEKNEKDFKFRRKSDDLQRKFKIDIYNDIDCITVFGKGGDEDNTAVFISGNIDQKHLRSLLDFADDHEEETYGQFTIHRWDGDEAGVFVDDHTILISGSQTTIKDTLDVISGKKQNISSAPIMSYFKDISGDSFIAAVIEDISSLMKGSGPRILKQSGRAFFTAWEKAQNINLKLSLDVGSKEVAENMQQVIKGMIAMANLYENETLKELKLQDAIKIFQKDNTIQMELTYPVEDLRSKALEKKMKDLFQMSSLIY